MILNIELNNENTIFDLENEDKVNTLTDKLKTESLNQWRTFIKNKYKSYEETNKIYNNETIDLNNDLVANKEIGCQNSNSKCTIENKSVIFDITVAPFNSCGNQIHYDLLDISNYSLYTVEFDAWTENPTEDKLEFQFQENLPPYRVYLRISGIKIKAEFQHYTLSARTEYNCQLSENAGALVKIIMPISIYRYYVKNLKLYKRKRETLFTVSEEKNLEKILYPNATLIQNLPNMAYDLRLFFMKTETKTQKNITNYIKTDLFFSDLLVLDSQINYGSFFSYERENDGSDVIDIHGYWDHPSFQTGHSWDIDYCCVKMDLW